MELKKTKLSGVPHLHDGLDGVDRHERDAEEAGSDRGREGLDSGREVHVLERSEHSRVGGGITKATERTLRTAQGGGGSSMRVEKFCEVN